MLKGLFKKFLKFADKFIFNTVYKGALFHEDIV